MKPIWDEARLAFRMTFVDAFAKRHLGASSRAGWWADPHLRKGYLVALPIFLLGAAATFAGFFQSHTFAAFYGIMLPAALVCNVVWFAVAARSRAKASLAS